MPASLVHCQNCRVLLNDDLESDSIEIPQYIPLREIASMIEVDPLGYYIHCPHCTKELRIARKYLHENVACKLCNRSFVLDLSSPNVRSTHFFTNCPHCREELRVAHKYMGTKAACKHCNGMIHFIEKATA
jgi:uncharacterized protein (DUF983 family)